MSNVVPPPTVQLICWSGETTVLACRLGISHDALLSKLRRVARGNPQRMTVELALANSEPLFNALRRKLNPSDPP